MTLRIQSSSFLDYLHDKAEQIPREPAANPQGLTILPGQIVRENLQEHINRAGIPTARLTKQTTIEDLARTLLEPTGEPTKILDSALRDRMVERILHAADPESSDLQLDNLPITNLPSDTERTALVEIATQLPYNEEDVRESFIEELDDYYRATDACHDHDQLLWALDETNSSFAQTQSYRAISAFRAVDSFVEGQIAQLPQNRQASRSHLVQAARGAVRSEWAANFDYVEWVAIASISVFDNPTLRFLSEIAAAPRAPDVDVFLSYGSIEYNSRRIESLPIETDLPDGAISAEKALSLPDSMDSTAATELFRATQGVISDGPTEATFIEIPNDRRLAERIANDIRHRLQEGANPHEFLVIAPDAGEYKTLVEDAFNTADIPLHVQTRRPMADIPAYRYLRSFVQLIETSEKEEPHTHGELMDPLRLGYCPRQSSSDRWPIPGQDFTQIEQRLHLEQQQYNSDPDRYPDQGIPFETWREIVDDVPSFTAAWWAVEALFDDVESWHDDPPKDGTELTDRLEGYLNTYIHHTIDHEQQLHQGPAIDTTRAAITKTHATNLGERVRNQLDGVGTHYDRALNLLDHNPSWEGVGKAMSAVLENETYSKSQRDRNAIPLVDAGNAFFREAKYLYILGLNAEEFPSKPSTSTFLHEMLRQQVHDRAVGGKQPYMHLDNRTSDYGEAVDFYQAALSAATADAEISLFHTYRDSRGNEIEWSSFVDMFDTEIAARRTAVGEWLPQPKTGRGKTEYDEANSWSDVGERTAPRERLRTLLYNAHRSQPDVSPIIDEEDVATLLAQLDSDVLLDEIKPRIERYHQPPADIEIKPEEPAFNHADYSAVSGEPYHPHELDLLAQCGLKYYYYQFLYNFEGQDPERAQLPYYSSNFPHHRLGNLPYIVRENYADPRYVEKWRLLIEDRLPERQSSTDGLRQFESDDTLRHWLFAQDEFNEYDEATIYENLRAERRLVEAEVEAGISRDWEWRSGGNITIEGHTFSVPPYRADRVETESDPYYLPIFFTRFSNRAESAFKGCFTHDNPIWEIEESCRTLCIECSNDDCTYHSKYSLDHRLVSGREYERTERGNKVLGIGLQEQYGDLDGARFVVIKSNHANEIYRGDKEQTSHIESVQARGGFDQWYDNKVAAWEADATNHANTLTPTASIELTANESLVEDGCLRCVYRDLCMVPDRGGIN